MVNIRFNLADPMARYEILTAKNDEGKDAGKYRKFRVRVTMTLTVKEIRVDISSGSARLGSPWTMPLFPQKESAPRPPPGSQQQQVPPPGSRPPPTGAQISSLVPPPGNTTRSPSPPSPLVPPSNTPPTNGAAPVQRLGSGTKPLPRAPATTATA